MTLNKEVVENISEMVKSHRQKAGLTQVELARLAGVGKASIWDIEHAKQTVQIDTLLKVLDALNIRVHLDSPLKNQTQRRNK